MSGNRSMRNMRGFELVWIAAARRKTTPVISMSNQRLRKMRRSDARDVFRNSRRGPVLYVEKGFSTMPRISKTFRLPRDHTLPSCGN